MLRIDRSSNGDTHLAVSGEMHSENLADLTTLIKSEPAGRRIILDLRDLTLVDRDSVQFLARCEADSIKLKNCPAYVREWIRRERNAANHGAKQHRTL